jgi:protein-L-isoaspartate O-methyltransferase
MEDAFKTWDAADESLEAIEARIHDGVERNRLTDRARGYARRVVMAAPWLSLRPSAVVVEVGPGVAYVMQAVAELAGLDRIRGLDVAPAMVGHARARLRRDGLSEERFQLELYDGVTSPWPDGMADLCYSVAAIQHVPKPFAYNILFEMHRCLAAGGTAVVHVLNWSAVTEYGFSLRNESTARSSGPRRTGTTSTMRRRFGRSCSTPCAPRRSRSRTKETRPGSPGGSSDLRDRSGSRRRP